MLVQEGFVSSSLVLFLVISVSSKGEKRNRERDGIRGEFVGLFGFLGERSFFRIVRTIPGTGVAERRLLTLVIIPHPTVLHDIRESIPSRINP